MIRNLSGGWISNDEYTVTFDDSKLEQYDSSTYVVYGKYTTKQYKDTEFSGFIYFDRQGNTFTLKGIGENHCSASCSDSFNLNLRDTETEIKTNQKNENHNQKNTNFGGNKTASSSLFETTKTDNNYYSNNDFASIEIAHTKTNISSMTKEQRKAFYSLQEDIKNIAYGYTTPIPQNIKRSDDLKTCEFLINDYYLGVLDEMLKHLKYTAFKYKEYIQDTVKLLGQKEKYSKEIDFLKNSHIVKILSKVKGSDFIIDKIKEKQWKKNSHHDYEFDDDGKSIGEKRVDNALDTFDNSCHRIIFSQRKKSLANLKHSRERISINQYQQCMNNIYNDMLRTKMLLQQKEFAFEDVLFKGNLRKKILDFLIDKLFLEKDPNKIAYDQEHKK